MPLQKKKSSMLIFSKKPKTKKQSQFAYKTRFYKDVETKIEKKNFEWNKRKKIGNAGRCF